MSYILDALLKADQERQRQAPPGLYSLPVRPLAAHGLPLWPVVLLLGGLVAGGLVIAWLHPGQSPASRPEASLAPALPAMENPRPAAPAPLPTAINSSVEEAPAAAETAASPYPSSPQAASPRRGAPPEATRTPRSEPDPRRLYRLAELPADLQAEARQINIAGVAYAADAKERMAIINDRAWREGDEMTTGLKVESIASDGVVFNLKGYRFHKGGA